MRQLQAELGLDRIIKLASNEGPFGPLPAAVAAFDASARELNRYPDAGALRLRQALSERYEVPIEQVVVGNGADELIRFAALATLDAGQRAVYPWPSFQSYPTSVAAAAGEAVSVPMRDRAFDLEAVLAACTGAKLVFVANPNNPTGTLISREDIRVFVEGLPDGVLCVLDEAYAEYAEDEPDGVALVREGRERLCVLRTFSKVYGLAALRIGYAIASPQIADALNRVRPIFNVNQPGQEAALASLHETEAVARRIAHTRTARDELYDTLAAAGLDPIPSHGNFVYADVPGGDGDGLADRLLHAGFIVRALRAFGAPGAIRVTVGTDEEMRLFAAALSAVA
ncbi:MAG: histidinol-phosphate aminotransferase [Thermoleophilaceae bacterium]|jgi:histidinol-phosphate aminotransferase|nr:histidinol-phosphate aminotransferase [Thermoleophilaceae bacterium]